MNVRNALFKKNISVPEILQERVRKIYYRYRGLPEKQIVRREPIIEALTLFSALYQFIPPNKFKCETDFRRQLSAPSWVTGNIPSTNMEDPFNNIIMDGLGWLNSAKDIYAVDGEAIFHVLYHCLEMHDFSKAVTVVFDKIDQLCRKWEQEGV